MTHSVQHVWVLMLVAGVVLISGCPGQEAGPEKYEVTGAVTYDGEPIQSGEMYFEPADDRPANAATMSRGLIEDGRYTAQIVGGLLNVSVRDTTGDLDLDPEGAQAGATPTLRGTWRGEISFPSLEDYASREESGPVEHDIEISSEE